MKICSRCKLTKPIEEFHKRKNRLCESKCKLCKKLLDAARYKKNSEKNLQRMAVWRLANKHKIAQKNRAKESKEAKKIYREKAEVKQKAKLYYLKNRAIIQLRCKERDKKRRLTDKNYQLSRILRGRLSKAMKGSYKTGSAVKDLGCSIAELKTYLESKFQPGMSWGNYGRKGWHIDHILPLSKFDLTKRAQLKQACHYTNLQPLWAIDNIRKGSRSVLK